MTPDCEIEFERQLQCVVNRLRQLSAQRAKGSLSVHMDGSGLLGRTFTEQFTVCRDSYSSEKMGREIGEEELREVLRRAKQ